MSSEKEEVVITLEDKLPTNRSSRPEVFCKKGVLRNSAKFTGKHLCQSLFFNKVAGDSDTGVFLWILRNFYEHLLTVYLWTAAFRKPSFFIMNFESYYEVLLRYKYFWSTHFWLWNNDPFKIFWNLHGNAFYFFISSKWKKYYHLTFNDTFKMYCCVLC